MKKTNLLIAIIGIIVIVYCDNSPNHDLSDGHVIVKEHVKERCGFEPNVAMKLMFVYRCYPEKFFIHFRKCFNEKRKCYSMNISVDKAIFDSYKIGDYFSIK